MVVVVVVLVVGSIGVIFVSEQIWNSLTMNVQRTVNVFRTFRELGIFMAAAVP